MQVFYNKDKKLKFEVLDDSVYIKHNNDIYEVCEINNKIVLIKNGKDLKSKKKLPKIKNKVINPYNWNCDIFEKSEHADG